MVVELETFMDTSGARGKTTVKNNDWLTVRRENGTWSVDSSRRAKEVHAHHRSSGTAHPHPQRTDPTAHKTQWPLSLFIHFHENDV